MVSAKFCKSPLTNYDFGVAIGGLLSKLQNFKKEKINFWTPCILPQELYHYGFRGVSNEWFCNYLNNRKQFVQYILAKSPTKGISCGVPQGSILGPLVFILYMNDICYTSKLLNTILFADDTTVFYSHKKLPVLCDIMNNELKEICNWFRQISYH